MDQLDQYKLLEEKANLMLFVYQRAVERALNARKSAPTEVKALAAYSAALEATAPGRHFERDFDDPAVVAAGELYRAAMTAAEEEYQRKIGPAYKKFYTAKSALDQFEAGLSNSVS